MEEFQPEKLKKQFDPILTEKVCALLKKMGYENYSSKYTKEVHNLVLILRKRLNGQTLKEVAQDLGYSSGERIRQLQKIALFILKQKSSEEITKDELQKISNYL